MQNALAPTYASQVPAGPAQLSAHPLSQDIVRPISLRDLLRIAERYRKMIIAIVATITLGVLFQQLISPTIYQATSHAQVELIDEVGTNQADISSRNAQRVANAVRLHRSRASASRLIDDLALLRNSDFARELGGFDLPEQELRQAAINKVIDMVSVTSEPNSDLLQITVSSRSPELAAEIANQLPVSVGTVRNETSERRREELLASLEEEMETRGETAREAAQRVADFRAENRMLVGAGGAEDMAQVNRIAAQAASASAMRAGSAARSGGVASASTMSSSANATSAAVQTLERQRAELVSEQSKLATSFGPNHPDMVRVSSQLATVDQNLATERARAQSAADEVNAANAARMRQLAQSEASRDAATAARLAGIASQLEGAAYRNVENSVALEQLVRESTLADQAYSAIADRVEQIRSQMQLEGVSTTIVSSAVPDYDAVAPAPLKMTLFALIGSIVIAFLAAFVREFLDDRLRTAKEVRRNFALPTFGMLPALPDGSLADDPNESPVIEDPQSLFAEVARSAYTDVRMLRERNGSQVVLVTSPLPGDGKSTVSLTLAAASVAAGDRAVVLDLDLRKRGILQKLQNNAEAPDLLDIFTGQVDLDSAFPIGIESFDEDHASFVEDIEPGHITLLSTRRPVDDPAALLSSRRLTQLIDELRERFDFIVINAPATLAVRDARAMGQFADHTLMVSRWGRTTSEQMNAALELLGQSVNAVIFDHVDYAEHARRRYGDSVQFYVDSSDYYSDDFEQPQSFTRFKRFLNQLRGGLRPSVEAG
ncbi:succinoglycan biosynthesis protein exop [Qipengyuania sp. 1NDW9]|uniref:GumC family protein n=1 Tax=Qipengyuania xiapuensis TaxID=2867236 RepID=UPI001C871794|nr:division plane positioning ATPase MipZ [Qipengyuania xiapuensis]MBX7492762.1 succinoglycan biosynthesis protein exop [Qipengyuania xiapuensis]